MTQQVKWKIFIFSDTGRKYQSRQGWFREENWTSHRKKSGKNSELENQCDITHAKLIHNVPTQKYCINYCLKKKQNWKKQSWRKYDKLQMITAMEKRPKPEEKKRKISPNSRLRKTQIGKDYEKSIPHLRIQKIGVTSQIPTRIGFK